MNRTELIKLKRKKWNLEDKTERKEVNGYGHLPGISRCLQIRNPSRLSCTVSYMISLLILLKKVCYFLFISFLQAFYLLLENTQILKSMWWHFHPASFWIWKVGEEKKQIFYFNFCLNFWELSLITLLTFGQKSSFLLLYLQCFSFIQPSSGICNVQLLVTSMEF